MKQRTLRAQALEPRALLAVDVSLDLLSGELRITGTAAGDVVEVSQDLTNIHVVDSTNGGAVTQSYSRALVSTVSFRGSDGNDQFTLRALLPSNLYGQAGDDILIGGALVDAIYGGEGNDVLRGGDGYDRLVGWTGDDQLFGDGGADRLDGGEGDDVMRGGDGDDVLTGEAGDDMLYGEAGNDNLSGGDENDYLYGGLGDDVLRGGDSRDVLRGNEGHDQLFGDGGHDYLRGDDGNDSLVGDVGNDQLLGGVGADTLDGGTGDDTLNGDDGDDLLLGREGNDALYGGLGNDDLRGDEGWNKLFGDAGDDLLSGGPAADELRGGDGNDILRGSGGNDLLEGEVGIDQLYGDDGDDVLSGGLDGDALHGELGNDQIDGGAGDDTLDGGVGDDRLDGADGNDLLLGREGADELYGGAGNDDLRGDEGANRLEGGDGDDTLTGGESADRLHGGAGNDVLRGRGGDDLIWGNNGFDVLRGDDGVDFLYGGLGGDEVYGGIGDDYLYGEDGDDWLYGEEGKDYILGGAGRNQLSGGADGDQLAGGPDVDTINGGDGADMIRGDDGDDVIIGGAGGDNINGDGGNDRIEGNDGDDELMGGRGDDVISGGWGLDHLRGLDGDDQLFGDLDADILIGGDGQDRLVGGADADLLIGGLGSDVLGGNDGGDLLVGGTTAYDNSSSSLRTILNNWNGAVVFQNSAEQFLNNQGSPSLRPFDTVLDDNAADLLEGDDDRDWFFWFTTDTMVDRRTDESVTSGDLSSSAWIKRYYLDLLGRLPTAGEQYWHESRLESGVGANTLPLAVVRGAEYRAAQLRYVYRQTFGTEIPAPELSATLTSWEQLGGIERIWANWLGSDAFAAAHGPEEHDVLQAMFNVVARRTASELELGVWLEGRLPSERAQLAYDLIASDEVRANWLNARYRDFLHRAPDEAELDYWLGQLRKGVSTDQVQSRFLSGAAYLNQPYFDVTAFGAVANDAVDDSLAIQSALDIAGISGHSVIYLGAGTFIVENLRLYASHVKLIGPGTLKLKAASDAVGVLSVEGDYNVVTSISIDGNAGGRPMGRGEGLRVIGDFNTVRGVVAQNTLYDPARDAAGINFMIGGSNNLIMDTLSLKAGHSGYRQIGYDNVYRDIVGRDARVKGFNGMGDGSSFIVDGGLFETNAPEHELGVISFQVDPGPTGKRIRRVELRNVTVKGPDNSGPWTTNAAKFALVDEIVIENSSFTHSADNIYSLRFAEGVGKVLLRDVFLSRAMYMEQDMHDGSGLRDPLDELVMRRVTIGDGVHRPTFSMEEVQVGKLVIDDCRFIGFTAAGIDWETPEAEYISVRVTDTLFRGHNPVRITYDILPNNGGEFTDKTKRLWDDVRRRNTGGGGAAWMP